MIRPRRPRSAFVSLIASMALLLTAVVPAGAVTDGALDGDGHPYVGLMVAKDADGTPLWRCNGTLLSPKLFLTAGHCTESPAASAEIWFDADVTCAGTGGVYRVDRADDLDWLYGTFGRYLP